MADRSGVLVRQAELHEALADVISDAAALMRRRMELTRQLAEARTVESQFASDETEAARIRHEGGLSAREAEILEKEIATLEAEANRSRAQASTARQKAAMVAGAESAVGR